MKYDFVKLNEIIELSNGGHILYVYEDIECYVNNAVSYIVSGLEQEHHLLVVDDQERLLLINEKLKNILPEEKLKMVHYTDNFNFYRMHGNFNTEGIVNHFKQILEPFFKHGISIRTWAHVDWKEQNDIASMLKEFEERADCCVQDTGLVSICAYNAHALTASLQMDLMRCHEYFMTDTELTRSCLYRNTKKTVIFPSLSAQTKMQSEMDLYRQKLDFVHVVSHEVRNPLTVIKAYCSIMLNHNLNPIEENLAKIKEIKDYVDVIDNEMSHIIHTEQMLSNDLLWKKELVEPLPVIREVIEFMTIKARTQGLELQHTLELKGNEKMYTNKIGLKLILSNLLSNAIKYSYEQSIVTLSVLTAHDKIIIKVKDRGVGMTEEQRGQLFKKYGKFNRHKGGLGIGLYMVKELVDHFEGLIRIDSQLGEGTEATIELPLR